MKAFIDNLLNRVTMYRLMLYYLLALFISAVGLSFLEILPYDPLRIMGGGIYLGVLCYLFNWFFVILFRAKQNPESRFITALILALIIGPVSVMGAVPLFIASFVAMGSKYLLAPYRRHVFNPAAVGALAVALIFGYGSTWWVGSVYLLPIIVVGGFLIAYKTHRFGMLGSFIGSFFIATAMGMALLGNSFSTIMGSLISPYGLAPLLFFACVMLVEPMTSPHKKSAQYQYGALVGLLFVVYGMFEALSPFSLELALLSGNAFTRLFQFDPLITLTLRKKEEIAKHIIGFWFESSRPVSFVPGQFMQWELPHRNPDDRGTRRFFTISSSPTEHRILLTTKFADPSSTFKAALKGMREQGEIVALGVDGEFVLPNDNGKTPCVFIAGGIGVTPFRSMIKYMIDKNLSRPITLLYSNKTADDIAFKPLFDEAVLRGWLKVVYTITDAIPYGWRGRTGYITADMIREEVPDHKESMFYISGPQPMVAAFEQLLVGMEIPAKHIKTDYFPGYTEVHQPAA